MSDAMNYIRQTKEQVSNSFQQLILLFSPSRNKILFSNRPFDIIPDMVNTLEKPLFLKMLEAGETERVNAEWNSCLQLKEGQSRHFRCKLRAENDLHPGVPETYVWINFNAYGVKLPDESLPCILFLAEQTETELNPVLDESEKKIEQFETILNNYRKEYQEFIDIAAHDLDAPLRKLTALIERLTLRFNTILDDKDAHQYIMRINGCLNDMRSLIDGLTNLSRVFSEKREYISCDMEAIMRQSLSELQHAIQNKKAMISMTALPPATGDSKQYSQLFKNLLDNAIKFSKEDTSLVIDIQSTNVTQEEKNFFHLLPDRKYCKIEIADNGIGFKQEDAEKIFRPFIRLHGNSRFAGSGLGLAICKKIVENHKGAIYAQSRENSGACFALILPQIS